MKTEVTIPIPKVTANPLIGPDPREKRITAWERLGKDLTTEHLDGMTETVSLDSVIDAANEITEGQIRGRTVVDLNS